MNLAFQTQRLGYFLKTGYWHTSERVNPDFPEANFQNHLKVYQFVSQFSVGKDVLDVGCGVGYGSAYLSKVAKSVIGIDLSRQAILYARRHYPEVLFLRMNAEYMELPERSFSFIVSTENFEHLQDHRLHLKRIKRALAPGGIFFLATPNPERFTATNPHHTYEFPYLELKTLLGEYFREVVILETSIDPKPNRGVIVNGELSIFGRSVDTHFLSNTHSFFCFCR